MQKNKKSVSFVVFRSVDEVLQAIAEKYNTTFSEYMRLYGVQHIAKAEGVELPDLPPEALVVSKSGGLGIRELARALFSGPEFSNAISPIISKIVTDEIERQTTPKREERAGSNGTLVRARG